MKNSLKTPRGCPDWLPEQGKQVDFIIEKAKKCAELYGFSPYQTPIFESSEVFTRTLGDTTDIVTKEMYSFLDRNNESFTLRPEGTAPLVRLFLTQKLARQLPLKMYYFGPMFRYERPQKGRQRQFHQFGVEYLGAPNELFSHFEVLSLAWKWLRSLGLNEETLSLELNSIGSFKERQDYKEKLLQFLKPKKEELSKESQERFEKNPLRILDSKSPEDIELIKNAPKIHEVISEESRAGLNELMEQLAKIGVKSKINSNLVRGLDYYNDLVFEFKSDGDLGAQNTLLAGGRYDKLIESMGGPSTPAIGWAAGIERLMLLTSTPPSLNKKFGIVLKEEVDQTYIKISEKIRDLALEAYVPRGGNFSKRIQKCQKQNCSHVIIIGEDEHKSNSWTIKDLGTGEQETIKAIDFESWSNNL